MWADGGRKVGRCWAWLAVALPAALVRVAGAYCVTVGCGGGLRTTCFLGCSLHGIQIVADCTTTDSNGLLAITEGAVKMGCEKNGFCAHGDELLCPAAPAADGKW